MDRLSSGSGPFLDESESSRLRSSVVSALGSALLACAPALMVTGSVVWGAGVGVLGLTGVGVAALLI